jgi:hypothetical protein
MWSSSFGHRLAQWVDLRDRCALTSGPEYLQLINAWWHQTPWTSYHLHWDDHEFWPDPWQLLEDNVFCGVARALGMLYTVAMLERADSQDAIMVDTGTDNLVLVQAGKYILNWSPDSTVNINPGTDRRLHTLTLHQIRTKIR